MMQDSTIDKASRTCWCSRLLESFRSRGLQPTHYATNNDNNNTSALMTLICEDDGLVCVPVSEWMSLLNARGIELWQKRHNVAFKKKNMRRDISKMGVRRRTNRNDSSQDVLLITSVEVFHRLEQNFGMDKPPADDAGESSSVPVTALPLTRTTGEMWIRQRNAIQPGAFSHIAKRSRDILKQHPEEIIFGRGNMGHETKFDLKLFVRDAVCLWVVHLFCGPECSHNHDSTIDAFSSYWAAIRMPDQKLAQSNQQQMIASDTRNRLMIMLKQLLVQNERRPIDVSGSNIPILFALQEQPSLSMDEAAANSVNALVAAADACWNLVFWTLVELSNRPSIWIRCKHEECQAGDDMAELANIKGIATQGLPVTFNKLSCLGWCLIETARVYPPVWTLPRVVHLNGRYPMHCKLDVLSVNKATTRQWDVSTANPSAQTFRLASFGLGKRSCPAGTASLQAAYLMLRHVIQSWDSIVEIEPGRAVNSATLCPTLAVEGPQIFQVTMQE